MVAAAVTARLPPPACGNCRFFAPGKHTAAYGECRMHPPTVVRDRDGDHISVRPWGGTDEWCGQHAPRPT